MATLRRPIIALNTVINERYEIVELLGSGGMGWVARARDRKLDSTDIVLKFLHQHHLGDEQQFKRFKNEVLLMRELTHPNIVRTYDFDEDQRGGYFISMEYVKGKSLREIVDEHEGAGVPFDQVTSILHAVSCGMAYAHRKGIIHRDIKPDNILVGEDGQVRITDFGLARTLVRDHSLTTTGNAVGTPLYMSPEQLKGEPLDPRCDIYSFGILGYELITGERPFQADSYLELARQHMALPLPSMTKKSPEAPAWYQHFLVQCTAKNRSKRFQSFDEIADILLPFLAEEQPSSIERPVEADRRHFRRWRDSFARSATSSFFRVIAVPVIIVGLPVGAIFASHNNHFLRVAWMPYLYRIERSTGIPFSYAMQPVFFSTFRRNLQVAEVFAGKGKEYLTPDSDTLALAVEARSTEIVELLLLSNVDPNEVATDGDAILISTISENIWNGTADMVELLLKHGAVWDVENRDGLTPLMLAALRRNPAIVATILEHIKIVSPDRLQFYLNRKDQSGKTALTHAVLMNDGEIVLELLKHKPSSGPDDRGMTPLMYAAKAGLTSIAKLLVNAESVKDSKKGKTALHFALEQGNKELSLFLLDHEAKIQRVDRSNGWNTLMYAVRGGELSLLREILASYEDPRAALGKKNKQGQTAEQLAEQAGRDDLVACLRNVSDCLD